VGCFVKWLRGSALMWRKAKAFDVAVIDERRALALESHLTRTQVVDLAMKHRSAVIAIDSPCCCAPEGRTARDGELPLARSNSRKQPSPRVQGLPA
jgi:hypothetical protein